MSEPFWEDQPDIYDSIVIAGSTFSNVEVTISGEVGTKFDVKSPPNLDGARETPLGYDPAKPTVSWKIWHPNHWIVWQQLLPTIRPKAGKTKPIPVTVSHPMLGAYDLTQFFVTKIYMPKKTDQHGVYELRIELLEYFPQPKPQGTQAPPPFVGAILPPIIDPISAGSTATPPSESNTGP